MTAIRCPQPADPKEQRVRKALQHLEALAAQDEKLLFESDLYKRYRDFLQSLFANKCAYCETRLIALQKPVIEHYRPKAKVTDEHDNEVLRGGRPHPGYSWLAYEWGNLLPACWVCNSTYKKNRFPVLGLQAFVPAELAGELPLIYNPLNPPDEPERHLEIDLETGIMKGLDDIGRMTISVLELNRVELVDARRQAIEDTANMIAQLLPAVALNRADRAKHELVARAIKAGTLDYNFARKAQFERAKRNIQTVAA